jgi:plastocyanin
MTLLSSTALAFVAYAVPALAGDFSVDQSFQTFSSSNLNIHVGDQVTFHNGDSVTHNITVKSSEGDANDP